MKKIIVLGCPGSGKSFFAKRLHGITGIPLYHLDNIWLRADGTHISREDFDGILQGILNTDAWIIDGDYSRTYEVRLAACDTAVFLDFSEEQCVRGITGRVGKERGDCPFTADTLDGKLLNEVRKYRSEKRPRLVELLEKYKDKEIITFYTREDSDRWLEQKEKEK